MTPTPNSTRTQQAVLEKAGFTPAPTEIKKRLIVSVEGEEKTGKNHFAFTAPSPIAVFSTDIGLEGVVEKFTTGRAGVNGMPAPQKEIYVKELTMPETQTGTGRSESVKVADPNFDYARLWEEFRASYSAVLQAGVRTVVWDTATEIYDLLRLHRFGKLSQVAGHMYGPLYAEYVGMLRKAYDSHTNLILLHKVKPVYVDDKRTNRLERAGYRDTGYSVQVVLKTLREDGDEGSEFSVRVTDCRQNPGMNGRELDGLLCSFPYLAAGVIEDSELGDWE